MKRKIIVYLGLLLCIVILICFVFAEKFVYMNINKIDVENGMLHYEIHNYSIRSLISHLNPVEVLYKQSFDGNWDAVSQTELIEDVALRTKPFNVYNGIVEIEGTFEPGLYKLVTDDFSIGNHGGIFHKELHMEMPFTVY